MKTRYFQVVLKSEVFIGRPGTLTGGYNGKDYLPGQVFLGVAASRLYSQLPQDEAWQLFHSGAFRFGDGFPLAPNGLPAFPMPHCWVCHKDASPITDHQLVAGQVTNTLAMSDEEQRLGCRKLSGYITEDGQAVQPVTRLRMKTAIDPKTGRPAEGRLFGYSGIARDSRYLMCVEADDSVSDALFARVTAALEGPCRVGRSHTAEYGHVVLSGCHHVPLPQFRKHESGKANPHRLVVWLLSDLAVEDALGQPVAGMNLEAEWLDLPPGRLDPDAALMSWGHEAPYNAHYRAHEQERFFIKRGSVLVFDMKEDASALQGFHWLGLHRQSGLGRVWLNPPLLATRHPQLVTRTAAPLETPLVPEPPRDHAAYPLLQWLQTQHREHEFRDHIAARAQYWAGRLEHAYRSARMLAGADGRVGPSPGQWGRVRDAAREALQQRPASLETLRRKLFPPEALKEERKLSDAICKSDDPEWSRAILEALQTGDGAKPNFIHLMHHLLTLEAEDADQNGLPDLIPVEIMARLARHAMDLARDQEKSNGGARV